MRTHTELSDLQCREAQPSSKPYRLSDHGGLYLLINPTGGKLWRWKYRFHKREKQMAFGKYPDVPLARARMLHAEARVLRASGVDPMEQRKETKLKQRAQRVPLKRCQLLILDLLHCSMKWKCLEDMQQDIKRFFDNEDLIAKTENALQKGTQPTDALNKRN